jgi:hypothetical protein
MVPPPFGHHVSWLGTLGPDRFRKLTACVWAGCSVARARFAD